MAAADLASKLSKLVLVDKKVVTFRTLCLHLSISSKLSKELLTDFVTKERARLDALFLLSGENGDCRLKFKIVKGSMVEEEKSKFKSLSACHVYSVGCKVADAKAAPPIVSRTSEEAQNAPRIGSFTPGLQHPMVDHRWSGVKPAPGACATAVAPKKPVQPAALRKRPTSPPKKNAPTFGRTFGKAPAGEPVRKAAPKRPFFGTAATGAAKAAVPSFGTAAKKPTVAPAAPAVRADKKRKNSTGSVAPSKKHKAGRDFFGAASGPQTGAQSKAEGPGAAHPAEAPPAEEPTERVTETPIATNDAPAPAPAAVPAPASVAAPAPAAKKKRVPGGGLLNFFSRAKPGQKSNPFKRSQPVFKKKAVSKASKSRASKKSAAAKPKAPKAAKAAKKSRPKKKSVASQFQDSSDDEEDRYGYPEEDEEVDVFQSKKSQQRPRDLTKVESRCYLNQEGEMVTVDMM